MDNKQQQSLFCRICGLEQTEPPWGEDGKTPNFDICSCCGVEFGYEDCNLSAIIDYRKKWLENGSIWFDPKKKPKDWSLENQMSNVYKDFKEG